MKSSKPYQYIKGWVEFYKLKFKVTPDVLIPRPETELLVDAVLKIKPKKVLDLGTGSGCIAIAIAKNLPDTKVLASDASANALKIARQNAKFYKVNIRFILSNLLENISEPVDVIVTNLPYIPSARIPYLDCSVKDHEPKLALDGGEDGFDLYRELFRQIKDRKFNFKLLIGEIDYTHGQLAIDEALKNFPDAQTEVKTDLSYKQRILLLRRLSNSS